MTNGVVAPTRTFGTRRDGAQNLARPVISRPSVSESDSDDDQVETTQQHTHDIDVFFDELGGPPNAKDGHLVEDEINALEDHRMSDRGLHAAHREATGPLLSLIDHRWVDGEIEIKVSRLRGPSQWEPERNIHLNAPDMLFQYWDAQGGRPLDPEDPESFDIIAIRAHTKRRFLVEWTGYPPSENTWLPRKEVTHSASAMAKEYLQGLKTKE